VPTGIYERTEHHRQAMRKAALGRKRVERIKAKFECITCGKTKEVRPSKVGKFCSKACYGLHYKGTKRPAMSKRMSGKRQLYVWGAYRWER